MESFCYLEGGIKGLFKVLPQCLTTWSVYIFYHSSVYDTQVDMDCNTYINISVITPQFVRDYTDGLLTLLISLKSPKFVTTFSAPLREI